MLRKVLTAIVAVAVACAVMVLPAVPASAATITVTNNNDAGAGSFRDAVDTAAPGDTIDFAAGLGPIVLLSVVEIDKDLTITGNGVDQTILEGGDGVAVLWINDDGDDADVAVTITDLSVRDAVDEGILIDGFEGGTIVVVLERVRISGAGDDGIDMVSDDTTMQLTVRDSVIIDNEDDGIDVDHVGIGTSTTTIERSTISGNDDDGVTTSGEGATTNISDSTMADNGDDGVQYSDGATGTVARSTMSGNDDDGVDVDTEGSATIVNSTLSGNGQSGIDGDTGGTATVINSTIVGNSEHGVDLLEATATITNTIVFDNTLGDCTEGVTSGGGNIDGDDSCGLTAEGDQPETDPLLGALAANGGPTDTHLPLEGSPAIDAALAGPCPATDQRGETRPQDGDGDGTAVCDVGAVEVVPEQPEPAPTPTTTTAPPEIPVAPTPPGATPVATPAAAQPTFTG